MGEPVKLAPFLRDRCEAGQYDLHYCNPEKSLIAIPWPVAPRPNETLTPAFQMFKEWAKLSFQKRNNEYTESEPPTTQKHRFRNALARADGIIHRKDLSTNTKRIYEFVDTKKKHLVSPKKSGYGNGFATDFFDNNSPAEYHYEQHMSPVDAAAEQVLEESIQPWNVLEQPEQNNWQADQNQHNVDEVLGLIRPGDETSFFDQVQPIAPHDYAPAICSPKPQIVTPPNESTLLITLNFRDKEVMNHYVTNTEGCRVYYGTNIPDISQLIEPDHLNNITGPFRYKPDVLFGPETLEQVKLLSPEGFMRSRMHYDKTISILDNMERGLLLVLDTSHVQNTNGVPDVFALRLCQTRIFPCAPNQQQTAQWMWPPLEQNSIRRLEFTKVFDGQQFCHSFNDAMYRDQKSPSPSFILSLGQRSTDETLLVSLSVTVQAAYQLIQNKADGKNYDIFISGTTSMDDEAHKLAVRLKETITLDD